MSAAERGGDYLCQALVYIFLKPKGFESGAELEYVRNYIKCIACLCIYKHFNK